MNEPKLHHYVPQFYLKRFADAAGHLWAWDKSSGTSFPTRASRLAAERDFYRIPTLADHGHDPLTMEKQFSELETDAALIIGHWLEWLRQAAPGDVIPIPAPNREVIALHLALQYLRTADHRSLLGTYMAEKVYGRVLAASALRDLHTELLWSEEVFRPIQARLQKCVWVFARNLTDTPFVTSDNPIAFKTGNHRMWVKAAILAEEVYAVYPLAPDLILYCHPLEGRYTNMGRLDSTLSPIILTNEMVEQENTGQVFCALRFVLSRKNDFAFARAFAPTIGTDIHAPKSPAEC